MGLKERAIALDDLQHWLADASAGLGRLVLVNGEAGVGKTSVLQEFTDHRLTSSGANHIRLLRGACDPLTTPRPLGPLVDIAPALFGDAETLFDALAATPDAPSLEGVTRGPRDVFARVLDRLDDGLVWVVVVEDIHWADETTLDFLRYIARRITRMRVMFLATYRPEEAGSDRPLRRFLGDLSNFSPVRRLGLDPLSREAVAEITRGSGIDPESLYRITGGNPFYVVEVIAAAGQEIPATVRDAVLARAGRLSAPAREVLDVAAIVTAPTEAWLLEAVAGSTLEQLDECVAAGMLRERPGGIEFHHELARLAIDQALPPGRRVELHRRALAALTARPRTAQDATRLAYHAECAGDAEAVLVNALPAARWAAALGAHRTAAEQYDRALRFSAGLPPAELADLLERHSYECYLTGRQGDALASRQQALACWTLIGDRLRQGDSLRWLSRVSWMRGDHEEADRYGRAAVSMLDDLAPGPELAMAYSNLAQLRMLARDAAGTIRWGRLALDLAEQLGRTDILVHALNNLGTVEIDDGAAAGEALLIRSLALARAEGLEEHVARALTNLSSCAVAGRRFARAEHWLAEGLAYCAERDLNAWHDCMLAVRSMSEMEQGRWAGAAAVAEDVLAREELSPLVRILTLAVIGRVRARRGQSGVWSVLAEAHDLLTPAMDSRYHFAVALAWAEAAWLRGEPHRAHPIMQATRDSVARDDRPGSWPPAELAHWSNRVGLPSTIRPDAPAPLVLQHAGEHTEAARRWRELGCPYEAACALAESDQDADLSEALADFQRLGARPAAAAVSRRLRAMGVRRVSRGPRVATRANSANLTQREVDVLALVAEGLRNSDIGARLFISTKTVGHHVSAILAKLGVHSRGEAVRAVAEFGRRPAAGSRTERVATLTQQRS